MGRRSKGRARRSGGGSRGRACAPRPHTLDEPGPRGWAAPEARALCPGSTTRSSTSRWWRRTAGSTSRKQKSLKASWYVAPWLRGSVAPAAWPRAGKRARAAHCSHTEGEGRPAPRPLQAGLAEGVRAQQGFPAAGLGATSWAGASLPSVGRSQENAFVGHLGTVRASSQPRVKTVPPTPAEGQGRWPCWTVRGEGLTAPATSVTAAIPADCPTRAQ